MRALLCGQTHLLLLLGMCNFHLAYNHKSYFSGMNLLPFVAPTPGAECRTPLVVAENSPSLCPSISAFMSTATHSFPLWTKILFPTISGKITISRTWVLIALFF